MKKRVLSLALALAVCLGLLPMAAQAAYVQPFDVYQADGFYITAKPYTLNSTKYKVPDNSKAGPLRTFYDGYLLVTTADVEENYVNRRFQYQYNLADKDGNIILPEGIPYNSDIYNFMQSGHIAPSEGIVPYWDGESTKSSDTLMGFMDLNGNKLTDCLFPSGHVYPFSEGLALAGRHNNMSYFVDKNGKMAFPVSSALGGTTYIYDHDRSFGYHNGLFGACVRNDDGTKTYGYIDQKGNMKLPLVTGSQNLFPENAWELYAEGELDGHLMLTRGGFSEGYAVCYDLRSGDELAYAFAIIDTNGNVVGTFKDADPLYSASVPAFHNGLLRVAFVDNRGDVDGYGFVDPSGKVVLRSFGSGEEFDGLPGVFSCGVAHAVISNDAGRHCLMDTKGNIIIPPGHFVFSGDNNVGCFHDNLALVYPTITTNNSLGLSSTPWVLEIHQGTYTGSGRVYDYSKGGEATNPTTPEQPDSLAYVSTQSVLVDGKAVEFQMYALRDEKGNDTNYIKLRDLAQILNGSAAQFEVSWNGAVNIETGKVYTPNGSEMKTPFSGNRAYYPATATTNVNGAPASLSAFILKDDQGGDYTYYQLRDLGKALGFNVGWAAGQGIFVETDKPYEG